MQEGELLVILLLGSHLSSNIQINYIFTET